MCIDAGRRAEEEGHVSALRSLNRQEAHDRAVLIGVESYTVAIDLTGMAEGPEFRAVSTIRFSCRQPGAETFVDCAAEVRSASLNGEPIDAAAVGDARITLSDLAAHNTLVVESVQAATAQATAVHRSVDPADGRVYVWTSFEPDDARRAWACFDQPDLKAPHTFEVTAPADWVVTSNSDAPTVTAVDDGRRWVYPATPPLSTYVPVVNAGPFYELRSQRGGYDLGLYVRRSLASFLDRDAEELFDLTAKGLAFFGEQFALPFPQQSYDQVFAPDMGGAMENYGCVTWSDAFIFRSTPSPMERELRATVLLHEMAHMWFGDIVTMTWWNDLWLNEAFAEWACYWAAAAATQFTDAWAAFLANTKLVAYPVDRGPTSHPIRQSAADVAEATAGFDAITYMKGASVLKQLVAHVGEDAFVAGLRAYFTRHAWGNATLEDLMSEVGRASGRDLDTWTKGWLETAGTDTLNLERSSSGGLVLHAAGPHGQDPRTHRLDLGIYADRSGTTVRREVVPVDLVETTTRLVGVADPSDLVLVNDNDLTFATVLLDDGSVRQLLDSAPRLPSALSRAVGLVTVWDMLIDGGLSATAFVRCVNAVLLEETADSVIEPFLTRAVEAAERWAPEDQRKALLGSVAEMCLSLAEHGGSRKMVALRALARSAVTDGQLAALKEAAVNDVDLGWRALTRFAALDDVDAEAVAALEDRDPNPDAWVRALAVQAARPRGSAKDAVWDTVMEEQKVPMGGISEVSGAFWQPGQADVLAPFAERYLQKLPELGNSAMIPAMVRAVTMFPVFGVDHTFLDRVVAVAEAPGFSPVVHGRVLEQADRLRRMLNARGDTGS
jgi:aminopeptidase N